MRAFVPMVLLLLAMPAAAQQGVRVLVAVLPFEVHSAKPLEYLEGSLADLLATRLEASGEVEVVDAVTVQETMLAVPGETGEASVRRLAQQVGAQWVVVGSLTELAGQYSLDVRITPATSRVTSQAVSYSASGDDELLDRINELASRVVGIVTGSESTLRIVSIDVDGAFDAAAVANTLRIREGDVFSSETLRQELERLQALDDVATASVDTVTSDQGVAVTFRIVQAQRIVPGGEGAPLGDVIGAIEVRGNRRIEDAAIRARITSSPGGTYNPPRISEDVRAIYQLGFFKNVRVFVDQGLDGRVVVFDVQENPVVRQVTLTGNDEVDEEKIRDNLTLTTGSTLDLPLLFENRLRIESIYRAEGFYLARVRHEVEDLAGDAVSIHFTVDEGEKLKLRSIEFVGNEAFSDDELQEGFKTKTWKWHSLLTQYLDKAGTYAEPIFHQDLREVSDRYLDNGYIQADVGDPQVVPSDDGLSVVVRINEGSQFSVRQLTVQGDETIDVENLRKQLRLKEGEVFNRSALNDDVEILEHQYTDRGFYAAEVDPRTRVDEDELTVDVEFSVEKGPLYFLREIDIAGNTTTVDPVVRREMQMVEGELYSARAVDISKRRVEVLGFFEEVSIEPQLTDFPDQLDLDLKVIERPTGSLSFGAGFSSRDGFVLSGSVSQSNLFGEGYGTSISADIGGQTSRFFLSFSDPYFMGSTFGLSAQLFQTDLEFQDFELETLGAELVLSHLLDNEGRTRAFLRYSWSQRTVERDFGAFAASPILREIFSGDESTSLLGLSVRQDTRNDRIAPTAGHVTDAAFDFAGLGGFSEFVRFETRGVWYLSNPSWLPEWIPSAENGTWVLGARFGWIEPFNDAADFDLSNLTQFTGTENFVDVARLEDIDTDVKLPLSERYFLGGIGAYQLRGFEGRSVGPRRAILSQASANLLGVPGGDSGSLFHPTGTGAGGVCGDTLTNGAPTGPTNAGMCNKLSDRDIDDFADVDETDVIGGTKFFSGTIEYRFPISDELGLIGIVFVDFGNAFSEEEDLWDVGLWRVGTGFGGLWFSPFGPLQAFVGVPLDPVADEESLVFEFSVGGQNF
jgi:outer membrane protein insertion porin family